MFSVSPPIIMQYPAKDPGHHMIVPNLPASLEQGKKNGITDIDVLEATDYYKTPCGQKPHGATSGLFSFNNAAIGWDAFLHAEVLLTQPLMAPRNAEEIFRE